ncbi:hypothetical protein PGT21_004741 [Puccinia graminis f. sp. tritici]|uniref:Uncharacterized protein n=1 Tax=Puccinia graminis f. sp. tritici TaxID=56615 RepID=A0A5B0MKM6_PUCGR|nr:hypothetical protein PGT21_004741 [Puccinia graminis f. sp. tritici]
MCHSCSRPQAYRGPAESGVSHAGSNFRAHEIRSGVHGRNLGYSMIWKSDEPKSAFLKKDKRLHMLTMWRNRNLWRVLNGDNFRFRSPAITTHCSYCIRENDGCLLRIRKGRVVLMSHRIVYVLDPFPASNNLLTRTYLKKAYNHLRTS